MRTPLSPASLQDYSKGAINEKTISSLKTYINPRTKEKRKRLIERELGIQHRGTYIIIEKAGIVIDSTGGCFKLTELKDSHLIFIDENGGLSLITFEQPKHPPEAPKPYKLKSKLACAAWKRLTASVE